MPKVVTSYHYATPPHVNTKQDLPILQISRKSAHHFLSYSANKWTDGHGSKHNVRQRAGLYWRNA